MNFKNVYVESLEKLFQCFFSSKEPSRDAPQCSAVGSSLQSRVDRLSSHCYGTLQIHSVGPHMPPQMLQFCFVFHVLWLQKILAASK